MATTTLRTAKLACSLSRISRSVTPRLCVASTNHLKRLTNYHTCERTSKPTLLKASSQSQSEKKTSFPMNPNANVFQSQIYNQNEEGVDEDETGDNKSNDTSSFQGGTYTNSSSNYRDNPRGGRGGFRGGDRGGRGRGGMSNGYPRGGRGGDRNYSGNYQGGYSQRNDYNRSDGYQGYRGDNYNRDRDGGFKRGGGPPRGGGRGGPRGGFPRGGSRGGADRGGSGTRGFGRPNFNQQQTA